MEEIGYRTDIFTLDGIAGSQREYIHWLLGASGENETAPETILASDELLGLTLSANELAFTGAGSRSMAACSR